MKTYDVIIVGQGPAGMSAAIYASRANLSTLMIERGLPGGQLNNTEVLDNYLGTPFAKAMELAETMHKQALSFGAEEVYGEVITVEKVNDSFRVHTKKEIFEAKAVIVATGTQYKKLGISGEEEFAGRGVSYCAVCDGPFFKDKKIVVVGGGDSALEEADYLTQFGEVTIIHRRSSYRGQPLLQERVQRNPKIQQIMNTEVLEIVGEDQVEQIKIKDKSTNKENTLEADAVFVYIGQTPQTALLRKIPLIEVGGLLGPFSSQVNVLNHEEYVLRTNKKYMTHVPGLFAIGDILNKKVRQVANAVGEGAVAGQSAYEYIQRMFED